MGIVIRGINNDMMPMIGRPEFTYGLLQTQKIIYDTLFPEAGRILSLFDVINGIHDFRNGEISSADLTTIIGFAFTSELNGQMISQSTKSGVTVYLSTVGLNFSLSDLQSRAEEAKSP